MNTRSLFHATVLCLCVMISGCANLYASRVNVTHKVDDLITNEQFDLALNTISAMSPNHKDFEQLRDAIPIIEQQRQLYIEKVLTHAAGYAKAQDWKKAELVIQAGVDNVPSSTALQEEKRNYYQQRQIRLAKDDASILVAQAYFILKARPYQESKLYNANNRFFATQEFNRFLGQANKVSQALYKIGANYHKEGKAVQAREALTLSVKIADNELSSLLLNEILSEEQEQRTVQRKQQQTQIKAQQPELESSFYERLNFGDFDGAQKLLNEMKAINIETVPSLQNKLDSHKQLLADQLIASGDTLYNSGFLAEAINRWEQALRLVPENSTLIQKLERANTFSGNLERWKEKP